MVPLTRKELWLKLFSENDTALACAIHLCERFITDESLKSGEKLIIEKRRELYGEVSDDVVESVFRG